MSTMTIVSKPSELPAEIPAEIRRKVEQAYYLLREFVSHIEYGECVFRQCKYVVIILKQMFVELPKEVYEKLKELGFVARPCAYGACGTAEIEEKVEGEKAIIEVIPCWCHPWHYLLGFEIVY